MSNGNMLYFLKKVWGFYMTKPFSSPLRYPGGKAQLYDYVSELIEINNCKSYIEPFMGGAGIAFKLLVNNKVKKVFLNDFDRSIYAFWYSVLYFTEELVSLINITDVTVAEWRKQKAVQNNKETADLLDLGFSTFFLNRTNRSGIIKAGVIGGFDQRGIYKLDCRYNKSSLIKRIRIIASYKSKINLYNQDAEVFIKNTITKTKESFTFFDPPYYNRGPELYTNFYTHDNHEALSKTISINMKEKTWILTYDNSEVISEFYKEFIFDMYYLRYSIAKPQKGIEFIFYSPNLNHSSARKFIRTIGKD